MVATGPAVGFRVGVLVGVRNTVAVALGLGVFVRVSVGVCVGTRVAVAVAVRVAVSVGIGSGVSVSVGAGVAVGEAHPPKVSKQKNPIKKICRISKTHRSTDDLLHNFVRPRINPLRARVEVQARDGIL